MANLVRVRTPKGRDIEQLTGEREGAGWNIAAQPSPGLSHWERFSLAWAGLHGST